MSFINRHRIFYAVGVDIFEPWLKQCQKLHIYHGLVLADVTKLPFKARSFDIVLAMEVLEHLERETGQELLKAIEKIATKQVIISTPVGRYEQGALGNNPHQEHRAFWHPAELKHLDYKVRGHGLRGFFGEKGLMSHIPQALRPLGNILWVCAGPFVHFSPDLAGDMVGIKNLRS